MSNYVITCILISFNDYIFRFSKENNIHGINPIIISTAYILLTLLLASLSRKIVKLIFGDSESILKQILLEFIATLELCATCFELIIGMYLYEIVSRYPQLTAFIACL